VLGYITSKYFGVRSFGTIFGVVSGLFALGAGVGPQVMSMMLDRFGSYSPVMLILFVALLFSALLFATLGRRPILAAVATEPPGQRDLAPV
jgi:nitrate/nitrite transporter NarK